MKPRPPGRPNVTGDIGASPVRTWTLSRANISFVARWRSARNLANEPSAVRDLMDAAEQDHAFLGDHGVPRK